MHPTRCYTTQQQIKIIEVFFAAKSVLLTQQQCREDFGRNNVPAGRINFGRQEVWQMTTKADIVHPSA